MSIVLLENGPADGVRLITLNDPDRRNAMSPALLDGLSEKVDQVKNDADARVLVITGNGLAFSAGADLPALFGKVSVQDTDEIRDGLLEIYRRFLVVRDLEIPTIAAINGHAVGAGVNLAMACDLRIAGPAATFGVTFTKIGLHPGGGCTWFLTQALGKQRALKLILDGGSMNADEAHRAGLVLEVSADPLQAALGLAGKYSAIDPDLAKDIKRSVAIAATSGFEASLENESWAQAKSAKSAQFAETVARFAR